MTNYIYRHLSAEILECQKYYQVITITGPRQVGKTTLCRNLFPDYAYYNMEDISLREEIERDPKSFFANAGKHVIIDEVQNVPSLLSYLMVYVDNDPEWRFVLTGSCNITVSLWADCRIDSSAPFVRRDARIQEPYHRRDTV